MDPAGYQVALDVFEGPLDLLLHLVKKHELSILDIPIAFVTERYLEYLDAMAALDIDVAGEYLLMAATLCHIKSRELLPTPEPLDDEDGEGGEAGEGDIVLRAGAPRSLAEVKAEAVVTFLALLEMAKLRLIALSQPISDDEIIVERAGYDLRARMEHGVARSDDYR